ncbi:MAG: hypothetical protein HY897_09385 [Deltaproteobacteria bacterium]|nr:hypothetical protein [Deltaproteobacteria bacterium]
MARNRVGLFFLACSVLALGGCLENEILPPSAQGADGGLDGAPPDTGGQAGDAGAGGGDDDEEPTDGGVLRHFTYRAISGVSMGACATGFIGGRHPDKFDLVGALGGYIDMVYLLHMVKDRKLSGFCPMQQILDNLADANDPDNNPHIYCGPVAPDQTYHGLTYEHPEDFNHWFFADYSAEFDRTDAIEIFQDLSMGLGNAYFYNEASPYLPSGVTLPQFHAWLSDPHRCQPGHALTIDTPPYNCNREYNPQCEYPLVFFCDGEEPVGCWHGEQQKCGKNNPDYWTLKGSYDPYYTAHDRPAIVLAAVDYNRNGVRDYAEPVVVNFGERFSDTGADGCFNLTEDGKGGCCPGGDFEAGKCERPWDAVNNRDPNHDDYDWEKNGAGTEANWLFETGEPYDDFGLDGVAAGGAAAAPADYGEANGRYDYSPSVKNWLEHDIAINYMTRLAADPAAIDRVDIYIDGGIRDVFNSAVGSLNTVGRLRAAGLPFTVYDHFVGLPGAMVPDTDDEGDFMNLVTEIDFSRDVFGKNVLLLYGLPDASQKAIKDGDGGHVGTIPQAVNRFLTWFTFAAKRWPRGDRKPHTGTLAGLTRNTWFHSPSMDAWRRFTISLPPGYDDPANAEKRYPVIYFMHGYGMDPGDMGASAVIFQGYMADGKIPKFIIIYPDGKCCLINKATGARECACVGDPDDGSMYRCVGEGGVERPVPKAEFPERECNGGTFYLDMTTDRYGDPTSAAVMKYESSVLDLIDHIDATYRTKLPEDVYVKQ